MEIVYGLADPQQATKAPVILTIGNFDGLHLGHQSLLGHMKQLAEAHGLLRGVITFQNHPLEVLKPELKVELLTSLPHKIALMQALGIDFLMILPFTKAFASQTPEEFLNAVYQVLPFSCLVLGHDATLGKDKSGDRECVGACVAKLGALVQYVAPYQLQTDGVVVSSSKIREAIRGGDLKLAALMLGRPFSIMAEVVRGDSQGRVIGFPTLNIDPEGLSLPPEGVYAVKMRWQKKIWSGVANLGVAPTMRSEKKKLLEVHLFDFSGELYGEKVEVIFCDFIRQEKRFSDIKQLQEQIRLDIEMAKSRM